MYFDEDGHLAHEFYQEERVTGPSGGIRWRMRQIFDRLVPQVRKESECLMFATKRLPNL